MCIDTAIQSRNDLTQQCKDAASTLTVQINSNSLLGSVSIDHSALSDFCKSSCGPEIINTWMSCGAYDDIKAEARLQDCVVYTRGNLAMPGMMTLSKQ